MSYPFNSLYEMVLSQGEKQSRRVALFVDKEKIPYREMLSRIDSFAGYLHSIGIKEGDSVALFLRNSPEFIIAIFAISKVGAISVPINTFLKSTELKYILEDSSTKLLIASSVYEDVVLDAIIEDISPTVVWEGGIGNSAANDISFEDTLSLKLNVDPIHRTLDDVAVIIYTSGTTGRPKGAMLTNKNIFSNCQSSAERIKVTRRDRSIVFLPMFHSFTLTVGVILFVYVGGSIVVIKSLKPFSNIFRQILLKRVTLFIGVPDVYNAIAKAKLPWYFMRFNRLRAFISGAAALQEHTLVAMREKFGSAILLEGYGLSEASPVVSVNPLDRPKAKSVGLALKGYEIKIVDEDMVELARGEVGDIITRGDNIMRGYLNRPGSTEEVIVNGWLLTGDMGYMDDDGYLYIVDRKKDLIISKGINIYPREIEEVIDRFDGVSASAVVGRADEKSGEIPIAYIELDDDIDSIDIAKLRNYLREHLANYKIPKSIKVLENIPKNATGKVLKRELREELK